MATDAEIAEALRTAINARATSGATGTLSITLDGLTTTFSDREAREALLFHERRAGRSDGSRPMIRNVDLRGAF